MRIAQSDFSSGRSCPLDCTKTTQEYLRISRSFRAKCDLPRWGEVSAKPTEGLTERPENMQARCVPRFIQCFLSKKMRCRFSCAAFLLAVRRYLLSIIPPEWLKSCLGGIHVIDNKQFFGYSRRRRAARNFQNQRKRRNCRSQCETLYHCLKFHSFLLR